MNRFLLILSGSCQTTKDKRFLVQRGAYIKASDGREHEKYWKTYLIPVVICRRRGLLEKVSHQHLWRKLFPDHI